jgi:hypothetical protein
MSTAVPDKIVDKAKTKLETFFMKMQEADEGFRALIQSCFDLFWFRYSKDLGSMALMKLVSQNQWSPK